MRPDVELIRQAARGRWPEILSQVAAIDSSLLDGNHHACPKCGGHDRFRMIDEQAGAVLCNQCFSKKNGDGFAAVQWLLGEDFLAAAKRIADYLGVEAESNGKSRKRKADPVKDLEFVEWDELRVAMWCGIHKKGIEPAALKRVGARCARYYKQHQVIAIPVWGQKLTAADPVGWVLYASGGGTLPKFSKGKPVEQVKTKLTYGSQPGIIGPVDDIAAAKVIWKVEGVTDVLAALSFDLPVGEIAITNASGCGERPAKWMLDLFAGKHSLILHDADQPGDAGAVEWSKAIATTASEARHVRLPYEISATHGKDLRDWKLDGAGGYSDLVRLRHAAEVILPQSLKEWSGAPTDEDFKKEGLVPFLANAILEFDSFAVGSDEKLYKFHDGVYQPNGIQAIRRSVKRLLNAWDLNSKWKARVSLEVIEYIATDAPTLWEEPPADILNLKNGLLRLSDRELLPHCSKHYWPVQLPVEFDPDATCPATDKFDSQVFPSDAVALSHEIAAWLICPQLKIQKALLLLGEGGNGKSRKLNQYANLIGTKNCAAISQHDLESNRFAVARLYGKLANIVPDLPSEHLCGTTKLKAITGGDRISGENKFAGGFEFQCYSRLVYSANHPPRSNDASEAFFDRWVVIPFQGRFRGTAKEIPEAELDAILTSPGELSGLLNHALARLDELRKTARFAEPDSVREAHREFYAMTDPLAVWLERFTIDDPDAQVPKSVIRSAYGAECERRGRPPLSDKAFGTAMRKHRPSLDYKQRTVNGRLQWCYIGLGMRSEDYYSQSSQGSQDTRTLCYTRGEEDTRQESIDGRDKLIVGDPVNPVNVVNSDCKHHDSTTWIHRDGKAYCPGCSKYLGRVPQHASRG